MKVAPAPGAEVTAGLPAQGLGDGPHDREPQPGALTGPRGVRSVEAVEGPGGLLRIEPRALVAHLHHPHPLAPGDRDGHRGAGRGVGQCVADQVVGHLGQAVAVAQDDHRPAGAASSTGRSGSAAGESSTASRTTWHRSTGSRSSGRPWSRRASSSRSSTRPPIRRASCSIRATARSPALLVGEGALAQQLGVAADGGQRRAQLVRGVGDEAAQPILGGGLLGERRLDLGQHGVEGRGQLAHLGGLVVERRPAG